MNHKYQKIWSKLLYLCVILPLISQKCRWKQYRQLENGRKIHNSSALLVFIWTPCEMWIVWIYRSPLGNFRIPYIRATLCLIRYTFNIAQYLHSNRHHATSSEIVLLERFTKLLSNPKYLKRKRSKRPFLRGLSNHDYYLL